METVVVGEPAGQRLSQLLCLCFVVAVRQPGQEGGVVLALDHGVEYATSRDADQIVGANLASLFHEAA